MPSAHTLHRHTTEYEPASPVTSSKNGTVSTARADWRDPRYQAYALMQQYPELNLADAFALVQSGMSIDELKNRRDRTQK